MNALCSLTRGKLPPVYFSLCRNSTIYMQHARSATNYTKQQKRTIAKYGNRNSTKNKPDHFLPMSKNQQSSKGGDKRKQEEEDEYDEDRYKNILEGSGEGSEMAGQHKDSRPPEQEPEDKMLGIPDFYNAIPNYDEYDSIKREPEIEEVSTTILDEEQEQTIQRLWAPFETKEFNLQALIGHTTAPKQSKTLVEEEIPSKLLYYSDEDLKKYLPEGVAGRIRDREFKLFPRKAMMVRPDVEKILDWLESWKNEQFIGRREEKDYYTLLSGPIGSGKSVMLNSIVHWARLTGWLVLFVPNGGDWIGSDYLSGSRVNETWFGQPEVAVHWITALMSVHGDKLRTLKQRTTFVIRDEDPDVLYEYHSDPNKTLEDLLQWGLDYPDQSSDVVWHLRQEMCGVHEYPVLLVVDGVNQLRGNSPFGDPIDPANMKPMQIVKPDRDMRRKQYVFDKQLNIFNVPAISRSEAHVLAKWYDENEANAEPVPAQTIDYMWAISEGNGDLFWKELGIEVEQEDKRPKLDNEDDDSQ